MSTEPQTNEPFIHPNALVETRYVGPGTRIWAFVHVLNGAKIGRNCNICDFCFIEGGVEIGDDVTVKCGVYLWTGVELEDRALVGPNVVFTNNIRPRSKGYMPPAKTLIRKGASLGANSTILAGIEVGEYAMTGIGSVVTRSVPAHALVYGNPARFRGWVDTEGNKLVAAGGGKWISPSGVIFRETPQGLKPESI